MGVGGGREAALERALALEWGVQRVSVVVVGRERRGGGKKKSGYLEGSAHADVKPPTSIELL